MKTSNTYLIKIIQTKSHILYSFMLLLLLEFFAIQKQVNASVTK